MYIIDEIKNSFRELVGWQQPFDQYGGRWQWNVGTSESGLFYNDTHPLLTNENIRAIMPEDYYKTVSEWHNGYYYVNTMKVRVGKDVYICTSQTSFESTVNPELDTTHWNKYDILQDYLTYLTDQGITQMVAKIYQNNTLVNNGKNLLEQRPFFDGTGRLNATIQNNHKLVGFEITPVRALGVTTVIEMVGLQMVGGTGKIKLYLFHSSQVEPYNSIEVEFTKTNGGFQWFYLNWWLPYMWEDNNAGGSWYLLYNQDELPDGVQAINFVKDWSKQPCGTCSPVNLETWKQITKYLQVSPFQYDAPTTFVQYPEMMDVEDIYYTNSQNYGMNCIVSVGCDLTYFFLSQRLTFAPLLQKQVAYNVLRTMAMNPDVRVNRNQSNASRMDILYELDGNTNGRAGGLGYELENQYKATNIDISGIDRICIPCDNHGVKYRTV